MFTRTRVRWLATATAGLTFALILLGEYTGAIGAGLACSAQWPLCDGGVLPQTLPSFVEWLHRFVAMVTGIAILGTAYGVWRAYGDRRVRAASAVAVGLLPLQVLLGRETVFTFTPAVQTAHHGVALLIFGALVATALWTGELTAENDVDADADATSSTATGTGTGVPTGDGGSRTRSDD